MSQFRPRIRPQAFGQIFNDDVSGISSTSETFFMERTPLQEKKKKSKAIVVHRKSLKFSTLGSACVSADGGRRGMGMRV